MYAKVMASGAGVVGLLRYLTNEKQGEKQHAAGDEHELGAVVYRNLAAENPSDARLQMEIVASRSEKCKKPFMHFALSWPPNERPSEALIVEAMDKTLTKLGLEEHQAVYAIHREKSHLHIHAAINRVGPDGRAWGDLKSADRLRKKSHEVEKEMGFAPRELFSKQDADREPRLTAKQKRIHERTGIEPDLRYAQRTQDAKVSAAAFADRVRDAAKNAMRADSWEAVHTGLRRHGLALREYVNPKNPKRSGLEVVDLKIVGERCAGSAIGSDFGKAKLEKTLGAFVPGQSNDRVQMLGTIERERSGEALAEPLASKARLEATRQNPTPADAQRGDSPLFLEYQAERQQRAANRQRALERQRARDKERREQLRNDHAAECRRVRESLHGNAARAFISVLSEDWTQSRERLKITIAEERKRIQSDYGLITWTHFVSDLAERGDDRAIVQISQWNGHAERDIPDKVATVPVLHPASIAPEVAVVPPLELTIPELSNFERICRDYKTAVFEKPDEHKNYTQGPVLYVDERDGSFAIRTGPNTAAVLRSVASDVLERIRKWMETIEKLVVKPFVRDGQWDVHQIEKYQEVDRER